MSAISGVRPGAVVSSLPSLSRPRGGPSSAAPAAPTADVAASAVRISAEARSAAAQGLPLFATDQATGTADAGSEVAPKGEARRKLGAAKAADAAGLAQEERIKGQPQGRLAGGRADEMLESLGREQRRKQGGSSAARDALASVEQRVKGAPGGAAAGEVEVSAGGRASDTTARGELQLAGMERHLKRGPASASGS